tara:strand:- start:1343 stop:1618 length:276 start_codon:yes stop_codon:yes gene_type:complete
VQIGFHHRPAIANGTTRVQIIEFGGSITGFCQHFPVMGAGPWRRPQLAHQRDDTLAPIEQRINGMETTVRPPLINCVRALIRQQHCRLPPG